MNIINEEKEYLELIKAQLLDMIKYTPVIYKYINYETGIKILKDSTIAFTNPLSFNDPYDCTLKLIDFDNFPSTYRKYLAYKFFNHLGRKEKRKQLSRMYKTSDFEIIDKLKTEGMNNEIKNRGVSCFSKKFNDMLMWSHYADSHRGICIGFELSLLYLNINSLYMEKMIVPVDYVKELEPINYYNHKIESVIRWLKTKSEVWSYEEEVRIIVNHLDFNGNDKVIQTVNKDVFHSVYLGVNLSAEHQRDIMKTCKTEYKKINLLKISADDTHFKLNANNIKY